LKLDSSFVSLALSIQWFGMLRFDISFSLEQKFLTQNSTLQIIVSVLCVLKVKHMLVQLSSKFTLSHFVSINEALMFELSFSSSSFLLRLNFTDVLFVVIAKVAKMSVDFHFVISSFLS
jgi:hypothetical protein